MQSCGAAARVCFTKLAKQQLYPKGDVPRLLSIANHLPGKGLLYILKALNQVDPSLAFEFHAYGAWDSNEYRDQCLKVAAQIGPDKVRIHDTISGDDKLVQLARADIYLFCPIHPEGHPWSIVEAMAAGLPIISADQGAIIESVIHEQNGYIVDPKDLNQLSACIENLIKDEALREKMSAESQSRYRSKFTEQSMIENLKKVILHYAT